MIELHERTPQEQIEYWREQWVGLFNEVRMLREQVKLVQHTEEQKILMILFDGQWDDLQRCKIIEDMLLKLKYSGYEIKKEVKNDQQTKTSAPENKETKGATPESDTPI